MKWSALGEGKEKDPNVGFDRVDEGSQSTETSPVLQESTATTTPSEKFEITKNSQESKTFLIVFHVRRYLFRPVGFVHGVWSIYSTNWTSGEYIGV